MSPYGNNQKRERQSTDNGRKRVLEMRQNPTAADIDWDQVIAGFKRMLDEVYRGGKK